MREAAAGDLATKIHCDLAGGHNRFIAALASQGLHVGVELFRHRGQDDLHRDPFAGLAATSALDDVVAEHLPRKIDADGTAHDRSVGYKLCERALHRADVAMNAGCDEVDHLRSYVPSFRRASTL